MIGAQQTVGNIYSGPRSRGHTVSIYIKGNTQRAIELIKSVEDSLPKESGPTDVLDFLVQYYVDQNKDKIKGFEDGKNNEAGSEGANSGRRKRGSGLKLPS